jgi:von Willebrand factor type A domain-containing protein
MRRSTRLLAITVLYVFAAGCGQTSSGPVSRQRIETSPSQTWEFEESTADTAATPLAAAEDSESFEFGSEMAHSDGPADPVPASREETRPRKREPEQRQYRRSGQLTAGSIDDVQRSEEFCQFLDQTLQAGLFSGAVKNVRPHVMLQLTTNEGLPVGGAEIVVESNDFQQGTLRLTSGSDGRAMLTVSDLGVQTDRCEATIRLPNGGQPIREVLSLDDRVCHIVVPDVEAERPQQLDLALVIDTTGSMGDELEYLKSEIDSIVARLRETFPNVDQRFALIVYRDQGDQYVSRKFDFTRSLDDLRGELSRQHAAGGGDYPEAVHVALQQAAALDWRPGNVARVAFLVGDAPPHDRDMLAAFEAASGLRASGVRLYPVASSGVALKAEFVMRSAAFLTMGQYLFLTDHSGIGNPHAKPHTTQYLVEHLDQLMVRMITSELCGRRLQPDEVLAIERGDMKLPHGPCPMLPEQQQTWHRQNRPTQAASFALPEGTGMWLTLGAVLLGVFAYDSLRSREGA